MPTIRIAGMSCAHCVASVTAALQSVPGLSQIEVTLDPGQARFETTGKADLTAIRAAIRALGFIPDGD